MKTPMKTMSFALATLAAIISVVAAQHAFVPRTGPSDDLPAASAAARPQSDGSVLPPGLTCRRADFAKAVDILADAAKTNPHLAEYYKDVVRRVGPQAPRLAANSAVSPAAADLDQAEVQQTAAADEGVSEPQTRAAGATPSIDVTAKLPETGHADLAEPTEVTPAALTAGDMSYEMNPAIARWVHYYTDTVVGRQTMNIGLARSANYVAMARQEFRRAGVPEDLVWLAHVESVWNPRAESPAAAGGIWQFIPATAKEYGLTVESGNDERADPMKQTRAAASYLHDLYTLFGDWQLAMAAYNSGEPRVMDAVAKGGRVDFWDLYNKRLLPKETRDYVPKILAAIDVASQADSYGFADPIAGPVSTQ